MKPLRIGLISDTHGLLRPEALAALRGSDRIVHAGDIGEPAILAALADIAPVTAVRGNNDTAPWASTVPHTERLSIGAIDIFVLHDLAEIAQHPESAGARVVVSGHSHRPRVEKRGDVLYVNPGSAGPRRFKLPVSLGRLFVSGTSVEAELITLSS